MAAEEVVSFLGAVYHVFISWRYASAPLTLDVRAEVEYFFMINFEFIFNKSSLNSVINRSFHHLSYSQCTVLLHHHLPPPPALLPHNLLLLHYRLSSQCSSILEIEKLLLLSNLLSPSHLATHEKSGFMIEITPEKRMVVFSSILDLLPWSWRPGQFSHPFARNYCSVLTRLHLRQALKFLLEEGAMNLQLKRSRGLSFGLRCYWFIIINYHNKRRLSS